MGVVRPVGHEDRLSLVEHLDELRTRLIVCIAIFIAAFSICYWQNHWLLETVNRPLQSTQNLNGKKRSKDPLEESARFEIRSGTAQKQAAQAFTAQSRYFAVLAADPKLNARERALARNAQLQAALAAKAQQDAFEAVPTNTARQPVTLGVTEPFVTTFTVAGYAALLLCLPFLLYQAYAFVLPAFSARQLAKNRGYVILVLAIVAAVATPTPDPVTMLLAMAPLVVLFELSVLMARIFERRAARAPPPAGGGP